MLFVGVSPARDESASYVAYGNSLVTDPWGTVLCRAAGEETILYSDLDFIQGGCRAASAPDSLRPPDGPL